MSTTFYMNGNHPSEPTTMEQNTVIIIYQPTSQDLIVPGKRAMGSFPGMKIKAFFILLLVGLFGLSGQVKGQNCSVNAGVPQTICANQQLFLQGSYTPPLSAPVIWSQVGGPAATIVAPTNLNTEVTNLIAGNTYTFRITTTCGDGALTYQEVTHTVKAITLANAGPDATYCPGDVASLSGNAPGANETGLWTGSGGGVTVNSPTSATSGLTITGGSSGPVTLRWTITNSVTICSSYDEVVITNRGGITPVNAGVDQTLGHCYSSTQSTTLNGSYAGSNIDGQQGTWSVVSGPNVPTIVSPNAQNTSVTNLIQGVYVFRWTVVGACASGTDEVQVTVPAPTADVTGASVTGGDQLFCDTGITSTVLNGSVPQYINETVTWALQSQTGGGVVTITSPNSPVTSVTGLASPNTYTFSYTINNATTVCSSSASVTVSYHPSPPTLSITSSSPIILGCNISSANIIFSEGGSGTTQYQILSGPTTDGMTFPTSWINTGASPLTINGLTSSGTYLVQMRRITTTGGNCSTPFAQISIVTSFAAVAANAGTDQILGCNVTSTLLVGNDPTFGGGTGQGTWSQVSGPNVITLSDPHLPTLSISGLIPGSLYVFRWVISGGPMCPTSQDDVQVYTASVTPVAVDAGSNQTGVCYSTPVHLAAQPPTNVFERGTWTVSPSAGITFSDIHSPTATVTGHLPYTTYTFTWTIDNGCGSASDFLTVDVVDIVGPIVANAGADQCLGSGTTSITLAGNNPSPGTGLWTRISGPNTPTITTPSSATSTVTGMINGTYVFQWAISSGGCVPSTDQVTITIDNPIVAPNAGADQQICGNSATLATLLGSNPSPGTGAWTQISGSAATITTPTNYTTTITGLVSGVYVFRYTITNGACISSDDVSVFVSEPAPSTANGGTTPNTVCGTTSVLMNATTPTYGSGLWTIVSGPNTPTIVAPSSPTTNITGLITGTYVFKWTVYGGTYCTPSSSNVTVNVTLNADAGSDQSYCQAITSVNLTGTLASTGTWTQIGITPNVATITLTSGNTAIASGLIPGVYTFRYTIAGGCGSSDNMIVTLYTPPSTAAAGADQTLCNATTFTMDATNPVSGTGTWSKLSGPSGGSFSPNANTYNATFTGAVPGVYVFQWTVSNGSCSNADQVRITNYALPSPAVAGSDQSVTCATGTTMAATDPAIGLGTWTFVSKTGDGPTATITNPLLYNSTITGLGPKSDFSPETYTFRWTVSNGNCTSNTDDINITVYQTPTPAYAGPDQSLCNQTSVLLAATPVTVGTGTWTQISPAVTTESFSNINLPTATVNNIIPGTTYVFRWTSATAFCSSYDEVTINNYGTPTTASVAGTATSYCTLVPIALVGNTPTVGTGTWTQISGTALTILSPTSPSTSAIGGTTGNSYGFRWTISNGTCTSSFADVTVTMNTMPSQALAGPDQVLCSPTTSATMAGNTPTGPATGLWTYVSGPVTYTITTPASPTTTITGLVPGTYVFRWSHVIGSCTTSDDVQITVYGATTAANAGADQTLCNATSFTMAGNAAGAGETGTWVRISGPNNPTITSPNSATTTITGTIPGTYVFRWRITSGTCPTYTEDNVTVTNAPAANAGPDQINSATCGLTTVTLAGNNPAPGTGLWTITSGAGGTITSATIYNTTFSGVAGSAYTLRWTIDGTTCTTFDDVLVTFNKKPTVDAISNQELCNGVSTTGVTFSGALLSTVYNWTNNAASIGLAASGTGNISSFTATNSGSAPVVATITVTPSFTNTGGIVCTGTSTSFTITVNPTPTVSSAATKTICDNTAVGYTITSATASTTFTWTASLTTTPTGGTINGIVSGSGASINTTLDNTGTSPGVVRYVITPTGPATTNCPGTTFNFDVTINPTPNAIATPTSQTICNGTATSIALSTGTTGATVTYSWTAALISGTASGFSASSGSTIAQTLINATTSPATVRYTITPAIGSCTGSTITVDIEVNPSGQVNQPTSQVVCNTASTSAVNFATTHTGGTTTYAWTNNNTGIGLAASGSGDIGSFTGTNAGTSPISGTIVVTPTFTNGSVGCAGPTKTFTITVNPTGQVTQPSAQVFCNSAVSSVNFVTVNTGGTTTYAWTNDNTSIGLAASGSGNLSFTATNVSTAPILANIVVTPTYTNGSVSCSGPTKTFTITINPSGQVNQPSNQELCNSNVTSLVTFATANSGGTTTYSWTNNTTSIGLAASGSGGTIPSFTAVNTGSTPVIATIVVTPTFTNGATGCAGSTKSFTITVNPTPTVTSASSMSICSGSNTGDYTPTSAVAGTTFTWTAANTIGTVTGYSASGSGHINETLTNTGSGNGQVTYTITPHNLTLTPNCDGPAFQLKVDVVNCLPKIGVAKQLVSLDNNGNGTYDALFNIRVQNYGNVVLNNVQVTENLTTTFGAGNYTVLGLSATSFDVNTSFTGVGNLLDNTGTTNILAVGASTDIRLRVRILSIGSYNNTVTASSTTAGTVDDVSQNGSDPDPDGDGNPGNNSVVTPVVTSCVLPTVNAGPATATICQNSTYALTGATASNYGTITWTRSAGTVTGTFDNANALNPLFTPTAGQSGTATLLLTATSVNGSCSNVTDNIVLTISPMPTINAGPDQIICSTTASISLTGTSESNTTSYQWSTSGTGVITNPTSRTTATYAPSAADISTGQVQLTLTATGSCGTVSDFMVLNIWESPAAPTATITQPTCSVATGTIEVTSPLGLFEYRIDAGTWQSSTTFTGVAVGSRTINVRNINYTSCTSSASVTVNSTPTLPANATASTTVQPTCAIPTGTIVVTAPTGAGYEYNIDGGAYQSSTTFAGQIPGSHSILVRSKADNSCISASATSVTVNAVPVVTLTVGAKVNTTCGAATGTVVLTSSDASTITLNGTTQASGTTFTGLIAGYYTATSNGTCPASASFSISNTTSTLTAVITSVTSPLCHNGTGSVVVTGSGGTGTLAYSLDGAATQGTGSYSGVATGNHTIKVTDGNGCAYTVSFDINNPPALNLILSSQANVACKGASTASAIVVATGGTPGYTYSVTAGPNAPTVTGNVITGMKVGAYTVHVVDANSCSQDLTVTITEPAAALSVTGTAAVLTDPGCSGTSTGSIDITVSGGTAPYVYAWSNGYNGQDLTNVPAGSYTVNVTDANGCTITGGTYTLTNPAAVTLTASSIVNTNCNASVGAVTLTGSVAGTISLDGGGALASPHTYTGLAAGYHTAVFTATTGGCTASTSFNILNTNSTLTGYVSSLTNVLCNGGTSGAVTVTVSGGTANYQYALDNGAYGAATASTTVTYTTLSAGSHAVKITDSNNCSYTVSFDINQPVPLSLSLASKTNVLCYGSATGSAIVVVAGGTTNYTYMVDAGGPNTPTITGNVITGMIAGTYTVRVTDANSCTTTLSVAISQPGGALNITGTAAVLTDPGCSGASTGSIDITVSGGTSPYVYSWSNGYNGQDLTNVPAGSYTVNVTDANGCTVTGGTYTLTNPTAVTLTASSIVNTNCNASVGAVTLTGSAAGTISLDGGGALASPHTYTGLAAGYHTAVFTATTGGCTASTSFNITNTNSTLTGYVSSLTNVLCNGGTSGAVTVTVSGGTANYQYALDNGAYGAATASTTVTYTTLSAGSHSVKVTDANNCSYTVSFDINQPVALSLALASKTNVACYGSATGSAIVVAAGGTTNYTYTVDAGGPNTPTVTGNVITGMIAGTYTVRVTDANSCTTTLSVVITEPVVLSLSRTITNVTCSGGNNGSITATISGGTQPYIIAWSNGQTSPVASSLTAGNYTITVTDVNNCTISGTYTVTEPAALTLTASGIVNSTCGAATGAVTLTANVPGTITLNTNNQSVISPLSYTYTGLIAGYHTATFTNSTCTVSTSFSIANTLSTLSATLTSQTNPSCNGGTGGVTVTGTGGVGTLGYQLDGGISQATGVFSGISVGSHVVKVSDANSCSYSVSFTIIESDMLLLHLTSQTNVSCFGGTNGSAMVVASGGTPVFEYEILSQPTGGAASIVVNSIIGMKAGSYVIRVTDSKGCYKDLTIVITQPAAALDITTTPVVKVNPGCDGASTGSIDITLTGGVQPYVYAWSNGYNGQDLSGVPAGSYTLIVTDVNGCTITGGPYVITAPLPIVLATPVITNANCSGAFSGGVTLGVTSGGTGPFTYVLSTGTSNGTGIFNTSLSAGGYTYTVTDSHGCTANGSFQVTDPNLLTVSITNQTNETCNPANNGTASVTALGGTGPYTFAWSGSVTQASTTANPNAVTGLAAGTYIVTVTDSKGCTAIQTITITQPANLNQQVVNKVDIACIGGSNGMLVMGATGGTAPFVFAAPGLTFVGNTASDIAVGTYLITVTDANGCTNTTSVSLSQSACLPKAVDDNIVLREDTTVTGSVLINDSDPNGLPLTITKYMIGGIIYTAGTTTVIPGVGTIIVKVDGTYSFTPVANFNGPVPVITYTVTNGYNTANANLNLTITPTDDVPLAVNDAYEGMGETVISSNLGANDIRSGDGGNVWSVVDNPEHGSVVVRLDGTFSYTPAPNYDGSDSFTYRLCDVNASCSTATVSLTVHPVNHQPVARDDIYTTPEDKPITGNVLSNDTDPDKNPLSVTTFLVNGDPTVYTAGQTATITGVGTLVINVNGGFTFIPTPNYHGPVPVVNYSIKDGVGGTSSANVYITVTPVNNVPIARPDTYSVPESTPVNGNLGTNDTPSGDGGNIWTVVNPPAHGNLVLHVDGTFTYLPTTDFSGPDSFTYKLCDTNGDCSTAVVNITVSGINHKPIAVDDVISTTENTPVSIKVVKNDNFGADGPSASAITVVSQPVNGVATVNNNATPTDPTDDFVVFTPNVNFNGVDTFNYSICDSNGDCDQATVTVFVIWINDVPMAAPDAFTLQEDIPFTGKVSPNDRPSNDGGNVWSMVTAPGHGNVILNPDGTFVYTPQPNYNGPDTFTYKVCDVNGDCSQALVTLTVDPVNDAPVAVDDYATTPEHKPVSGNVLTNDTDLEGDPITVTQYKVNSDNSVYFTGIPTTIPNVGSIVIGSNGAFTFTPAGYFNGTVPTVSYSITDGKGGNASANLYITVTPVNDPPIAVNDAYPVIEGKEVSGDLTINDSDPNGDLIRVTQMPVKPPLHGTVTLLPDGQFTYKPLVGYVGPDSFIYELCDNGSPILCSTATVALNITKDIDCEVLAPNSFSPNGDGIHDLFMVRCLYNYNNPEIKVYNRWGNLVFVKEHYGDVTVWGSDVNAWWDGRSNQKWNVTEAELPVGTYYYILKLDATKVLTGFLYLNR